MCCAGRGRAGSAGRSRFHLESQAVPGVTPGHHTPPALFLQHNLISYIQQEFLRNISGSPSDGEISADHTARDPVTTGPRDSLDSIVGTWAGPEVNLIKYQPGLSFLCDTNAY